MDLWYRKTLQACTDTLLDEYCIPPKVKDMMDKMFAKEYLTERQWFYILETVQTEDKMRRFIAYLLDPKYKNIKDAFEYLVVIIADGRPDISQILTNTLDKMKQNVVTCYVNQDSKYQKTLLQCRRTLLEDYSIPTQVDCLMDRMMEEEFLTVSQRQYIHEWGHTLNKVRQLIDFLLADNYKDIKGAYKLLTQVLIDDGRSDIAQVLKDTLKKTKKMTPEQEENIKSVEDIHELLIRLQQQIRDQDITGKDLLRELKKLDDTFGTFKVSHMDTILRSIEKRRGSSSISGSEDDFYTPENRSRKSSSSVSEDKLVYITYKTGELNRRYLSEPCLNRFTSKQSRLNSFSSEPGDLNCSTEEFMSLPSTPTHESDDGHYSVGEDPSDNPKMFISVRKLYEEGTSDEQIIQTLTEYPDSINMTNDNHQTLLMLACRDANIKLVRILLTIDTIDVNKQDIMGRTALFYSILGGDVQIIQEMFNCDKINTQKVDTNGFGYIWYIFHTDLVMYLSKAELNMLSFTEYVLDDFIVGMGEIKATLDWTWINTIVDCLLAIDDLDHTELLKAFLLMGKEDIVLRILQEGNVTINQRTIMIFVTNAILSGNKNCLITMVDFSTINLNILLEEELYVIIQSILRHNRRCVSAYMLRVINDLNIDQRKLMAYKLVMSFQTLKSDALSFLLDSYNLSNLYVQDEKGNSVYTLLCKYGSLALISIILHRSDIDFNECSGDNSFVMSLQNRSNKIPKLLLQHPNSKINVNHSDPSGVTYLHQACNTGNIEIIKALSDDPEINVNAKDVGGLTAMMGACISGKTDVVSTLLKSNKVNLDLTDANGFTCLMGACISGKPDVVSTLLKSNKVNLDLTDDKGRNALMLACGKGDLEMVGSLLTEMKDPYGADNEGRTCLMFGCRSGNWEVVELLLGQDTIHVNAQNCDGKSALRHSIEAGDYKSVELLLKSDSVDPNQGDNDGKTPLIYVCDTSDGSAEKVVTMLVAHNNIDVNRQDCHKKTPLIYAAERGNNNVTKTLLQPDIKVNTTTEDLYGMTAFLYGCETANEEIVFSLLETNQINVNQTNAQGITPFEYAYKSGNTNIIARLLQTNEIDVNERDSAGGVALTHAAKNGKESVVEILLKERAIDVNATDTYRKSALIYASQGDYQDMVETLMTDDDLDINYSDAGGKTGLVHACQRGHRYTVGSLMEHPDLDMNHSDTQGKTGLIHACQGGYDLTVNMLMFRRDLDRNSSDAEGKTGFIYACQGGYHKTVRTLIEDEDVDRNHSDAEGKSGLIHACQGGYHNTVHILIEDKKVDINHSDAEGKTGFIYACQGGYGAVINELMQRDDLDIDHCDAGGKTGLDHASQRGYSDIVEILKLMFYLFKDVSLGEGDLQ